MIIGGKPMRRLSMPAWIPRGGFTRYVGVWDTRLKDEKTAKTILGIRDTCEIEIGGRAAAIGPIPMFSRFPSRYSESHNIANTAGNHRVKAPPRLESRRRHSIAFDWPWRESSGPADRGPARL